MLNGKRIKELLRSGQPVVGTWLTLADPAVAEIMADAGLDFVIVDQEHSAYSADLLQNMLIGFRGSPAAAIVRVPWNEPWLVKHALDVGADGIMFPMIMNGEEAKRAVASTRYGPQGNRGFSPRRASGYGLRFDEYVRDTDESIVVVAQVEHIEAVSRVGEIAGIEGVDLIFVGPADLTASLGRLPEFGHPDVKAAIDRVAEACIRLKQPFGVNTESPQDALAWASRGAQFLTYGEDTGFLLAAITRDLAAIRAGLKG